MLRELNISHLAIVDRLTLTFQPGLNILTGETGAGKSIILGAMNFLLGERVGRETIRDGEEEATVEGVLATKQGDALERLLERASIPIRDEATVNLCRSMSRSGRSRVSINGRTATLPLLQEIGRHLFDIHGQNEHQGLLRSEVQMEFLDAFAKAEGLIAEYRQAFRDARELDRSLRDLTEKEEGRLEALEVLTFQAQELREAALRIGEDRELVDRRSVVAQSERLHLLAGEARALMVEEEPSVFDLLAQVESRLRGLADADPDMVSVAELFKTYAACLKDVGDELRHYLARLESNPDELARIEARLFRLESIKRKYGGSIESALAKLREVEGRIEELEHFDDRVADLEARRDPAWEKVECLAKAVSDAREKGARELEKRVAKEFSELRLGKSRLEIETVPRVGRPEESWTEDGAEEIRFLISTNPGERSKPLERILSGGEISRVMLALRSALAEIDRTPVLIFDEIDAGIGGAVAEAVGARLKRLARGRQVLCVTHLPQIAAQADVHTVITKEIRRGRPIVLAHAVAGPSREEEIARMLGGARISRTARQHAREMLGDAG